MIKIEKIETQSPLKVDAVTNAVIKKGFSPYIENNYWYEYDEETKSFKNTGVRAKGINGTNGTNGKDGKDGTNGINGTNGQDGYTPVRGTDYWTTPDIQTIENYCKNYIDTNITNVIGGEY